MAMQPRLGSGGPPLNFRLDEVVVRITQQSSQSSAPIRRVSLSGTGNATLERDGRNLPFRYPTKDMLALMNEFYRIRFFDLPPSYSIKYSVFLKDDGSIGTGARKMSDAPSTSICFSVAGYEKCVTYAAEAPPELEALAKHIVAEADRLVKLAQPGQ